MKNSFERATSTEQLEESKKKLKAFRSEIYNAIESGQEKKNAFTINREENNSLENGPKSVGGQKNDTTRSH